MFLDCETGHLRDAGGEMHQKGTGKLGGGARYGRGWKQRRDCFASAWEACRADESG